VNFVKTIRDAGGVCDHCIVIFFYGIYPQGKKILGDLDPKMLAEVEKFMHDPAGWSKAHGGASEAAE
jgi:orotate phosphoribosyltransferase